MNPSGYLSNCKAVALACLIFIWVTLAPLACFAQTAVPAHTSPKSTQPELVVQQGHVWGLRAMAFSPDEKLLATSDFAFFLSSVKVWDVSSGAMIWSLPVGSAGGLCLSFSPDGKTLAVLSGNQEVTVALYDLSTYKLLRTIKPGVTVRSVAFSPDNATIALGGTGNEVSLWNYRSGERLSTIRAHVEFLGLVLFSANGALLASTGGTRDSGCNVAEIWDARSGALVNTMHTGRDIWTLEFSPDGKIVVLGTDTFSSTGIATELWDLKTNSRLKSLSVPGDVFQEGGFSSPPDLCGSAVKYGPDAKSLIVSDGLGVIRVWDPATGGLLRSIGERGANCTAISQSGRLAATGTSHGDVSIYNTSVGMLKRVINRRSRHIYGAAICNNGNTELTPVINMEPAVSVTDLYFWNTRTGVCSGTMSLGKTFVQSFCVTPDGRLAATTDLKGMARIWDLRSKKLMTILDSDVKELHRDHEIAITPDGQRVAICGWRGRTKSERDRQSAAQSDNGSDSVAFLEIWNVSKRIKEKEILGASADVDALAFTADGETLLCKGSAQNIVEWKWRTGAVVNRPSGPWSVGGGVGSGICGSSDGRVVAVRGKADYVTIWNGRKSSKPIELPAKGNGNVAISPDGSQAAIGTVAGTINLWSIADGKRITEIGGSGTEISSISYLPDGKSIITLDSECGIRIWDIKTSRLKATMTILGTTTDAADEWISYTPDGYYTGSSKAETYIRWRVNGELATAGRYNSMRQPDRVRQSLSEER